MITFNPSFSVDWSPHDSGRDRHCDFGLRGRMLVALILILIFFSVSQLISDIIDKLCSILDNEKFSLYYSKSSFEGYFSLIN